jgi:hypothetical protein
VDEPTLGWAQAPVSVVWHRVRAVSEANGGRNTMLHGVCGLAVVSEQPLQLVRPKRGVVCGQCTLADKVKQW